MTVVVVDPRTSERKRLTRTLMARGHILMGEAASPRDGSLLAIETEPELVIADFLAFDDGLTWIGLLREMLPRTRVVVWSQVRTVAEAQACLARGATQVLQRGGTSEAMLSAMTHRPA